MFESSGQRGKSSLDAREKGIQKSVKSKTSACEKRRCPRSETIQCGYTQFLSPRMKQRWCQSGHSRREVVGADPVWSPLVRAVFRASRLVVHTRIAYDTCK